MPPAALLLDEDHAPMTDARVPDPDDARRVWAGLRLLSFGERHTWWTALGADEQRRRHLVDVAGARYVLTRDEAEPWCTGFGYARGQAAAVRELLDTLTVPELWTRDQAARYLGVSPSQVRVDVDAGRLYSVLIRTGTARGQSPRFLVADQVRAEASGSDADARARWRTVRAGLPTDTRLYQLPYEVPSVPVARLPLMQARGLAITVLRAGHAQGWLTADDVQPHQATFRVQTGRRREQVTVPIRDVPAWLHGYAAERGQAELVAYRPGMTLTAG